MVNVRFKLWNIGNQPFLRIKKEKVLKTWDKSKWIFARCRCLSDG
jgi:hypothetical protein